MATIFILIAYGFLKRRSTITFTDRCEDSKYFYYTKSRIVQNRIWKVEQFTIINIRKIYFILEFLGKVLLEL